jgi:gluconolactonase
MEGIAMVAVDGVTPNFDRFVSLDEDFDWLGSGYDPAEGPVWFHDHACLVFSDIGNSKRYTWSEKGGFSVSREDTGETNGLARDPQGRIIACEQARRRVTREELDGSITVVADNYRGAPLNRPNDVVVKSDGAIYFTDPIVNVDSVLDFAGVYRVAPDLGRINLIVRDFALPNGLVFSQDETVLYVNDSWRRHIRAFDLEQIFSSGRLNLGTDRVFCELKGARPGGPDGMKIDSEGNVWSTGPGGVWVIDPKGDHLGTILVPDGKRLTNLCFGGDDRTTLFVTTFEEVGRLRLKIAGAPVPPHKQ